MLSDPQRERGSSQANGPPGPLEVADAPANRHDFASTIATPRNECSRQAFRAV